MKEQTLPKAVFEKTVGFLKNPIINVLYRGARLEFIHSPEGFNTRKEKVRVYSDKWEPVERVSQILIKQGYLEVKSESLHWFMEAMKK